MIVFLNGKFLEAKVAKVSVFDHGFLYGDGVYETLRTRAGIVWQIEKHLKRLRRSAKLLGISLPWSDEQLESWVVKVVKKNGFPDSRIRITLTRGVNGYDFLTCKKPTLCIQASKLVLPTAKIFSSGVQVITVSAQRDLPEAKSISLLPMILAQRAMALKKAYEAIFIDPHGFVLEGTVTNIFIVKDGVLITPVKNILAGTTRDFVLKMAPGIKEQDFKITELYGADEVFITNAPRGIVPVVRVDGRKIGNGKVGFCTRWLMQKFGKKQK